MLRTLASRWNKQKLRCYEAKIEESEKAGSHAFVVFFFFKNVNAWLVMILSLSLAKDLNSPIGGGTWVGREHSAK